MFQSARHRSPKTPRWVRGLITSAFLAVISTTHLGCGLDYVFRNISPLHPTGWSFAWPVLPSQSQRLEEDIKREERDKVPILDPIPADGLARPASIRRARKRCGTRCPSSRTGPTSSTRPSGTTSGS